MKEVLYMNFKTEEELTNAIVNVSSKEEAISLLNSYLQAGGGYRTTPVNLQKVFMQLMVGLTFKLVDSNRKIADAMNRIADSLEELAKK